MLGDLCLLECYLCDFSGATREAAPLKVLILCHVSTMFDPSFLQIILFQQEQSESLFLSNKITMALMEQEVSPCIWEPLYDFIIKDPLV